MMNGGEPGEPERQAPSRRRRSRRTQPMKVREVRSCASRNPRLVGDASRRSDTSGPPCRARTRRPPRAGRRYRARRRRGASWIDDDPVQRRHRKDHAERRALRQDRGRQRPLPRREPFVDGVRGHRECRPLAGTEDDATDHQRREADAADHRKLRQRPDSTARTRSTQRVATRLTIEADHDRRDREQQEEGRAEDRRTAPA